MTNLPTELLALRHVLEQLSENPIGPLAGLANEACDELAALETELWGAQ